jgi:hypothetical protein
MNSLRVLLKGLIDYAGLFPPAELHMATAVRNYAGYRRGEHAWALGRFIVPVTRLSEFERAFDELPASERGEGPWSLSVLGGRALDGDVRRATEFNRRRGEEPDAAARVEAMELRLLSAEDADHAADLVADAFEVYVEVPIGQDPLTWIAAVARAGIRAKVRTGGVSAEMFPSSADLARFLVDCAREAVPFKATAGMHHAIRSEHGLASDGRGPAVRMHGFLNVFLAAAAIKAAILDQDGATRLLEETSPSAFRFESCHAGWRDLSIPCEALSSARAQFAISYGSCSFDEPLAEVRSLAVF